MYESVSTALREADAVAVADSGTNSFNLQRRSLGILSPGISEGANAKQEKFVRKDATTRSKVPHLPEIVGREKTHSFGVPTTRRIRRPTTIRRPKLIGKSVEGAAMQAVAASRKRASSNQFKNIPSQVIKPGGRGVTLRDPSKIAQGRPNAPARTASGLQKNLAVTNIKTSDDNKESRVLKDFLDLCGSKQLQLRRLGSLQQIARLHLMNVWWPRSPSHNIPTSILDFFMAVAPKGWQDICSMPRLPGQVTSTFTPTFASWIVGLTPGLVLVRTEEPQGVRNGTRPSPVYLCSSIRNVRGTKCCAIVRISVGPTQVSRRSTLTLRAEGWILNLPRRSASVQRRLPDSNHESAMLLSRDSAGMDKLMTEVHVSCSSARWTCHCCE
jgi:hypothetical protein